MFALQDVMLNDVLQFFCSLLAALGISISRKVYKMPLLVDDKVVDEHCFPRSGRRHGETFAPRKHIYKTAFPHVAAPDEGVFRKGSIGAHICATIADEKFGGSDFHKAVGNDGE